MAVIREPQSSSMVISIQDGVSTSGQPVYRERTYSNVKTSAADADVYAVAQEMANLQKYPVAGLARLDEGNLVNE